MEGLIEEIRRHPCLYDMRLEEYRDLHRKDCIWEEIAKSLKRDSKSIKQDWKKLRDCFRQAIARRKSTSGHGAKNLKPWRYEKQMLFLTPFMSSREPSSNIGDIYSETPDDEDESPDAPTSGAATSEVKEEVETSAGLSTPRDSDARKKRKAFSPDVDRILTYLQAKQRPATRQDDLDLFFMSACESTRKLPRRVQNQIKRELLESITRAEEQHDYEMSTFAFTPSSAPSPCAAAAVYDESNSSFDSAT